MASSNEKQPLPEGGEMPPPPYSEINLNPGPSTTQLGPSEQPFAPYPTQHAPYLPPGRPAVVTMTPGAQGLNGQQQSVLVINARRPRVFLDDELLPPFSVQLVCPCCRQMVQTRIEYRPGSSTHFAALLLCIFGCWPCCILPYFMTSCQFPSHFCPNCQTFLGFAPNV
ncbi:lipopolysaccharide-induced tumor necrosis factor-alpha factor-like [Neocloeon triangulifer]|uniref:lipopolysaccharide-induced tumor necrosis factor-alpha factor-like n=1 Tax=Neocloeon triangulifer TaxID=2078957 RepID=UPI00286F0EC1|nr:lipopolysaccharide-induced tumor necrosis factor-alpha factor-like [Neocloeon triangulifer]